MTDSDAMIVDHGTSRASVARSACDLRILYALRIKRSGFLVAVMRRPLPPTSSGQEPVSTSCNRGSVGGLATMVVPSNRSTPTRSSSPWSFTVQISTSSAIRGPRDSIRFEGRAYRRGGRVRIRSTLSLQKEFRVRIGVNAPMNFIRRDKVHTAFLARYD